MKIVISNFLWVQEDREHPFKRKLILKKNCLKMLEVILKNFRHFRINKICFDAKCKSMRILRLGGFYVQMNFVFKQIFLQANFCFQIFFIQSNFFFSNFFQSIFFLIDFLQSIFFIEFLSNRIFLPSVFFLSQLISYPSGGYI